VAFLLGAFPRVELDWAEAGAGKSQIEIANTFFEQLGCGGNRSGAIIGLHQNAAKAVGRIIRLDKNRFAAVIAGQAGARRDANFHFVKQETHLRRPNSGRNGLAVVRLDDASERFELELQPGTVLVVKVAQLDERVQSLAGSGQRPVSDHIKFGLGRAVTVAGQIVADILHTLLQEITFTQLQREAVLLADSEDTVEIIQQVVKENGVEQDVVDDDTVACVLGLGIAGLEKSIPFLRKDVHEAGIEARGVARTKRHDRPSVLLATRREESELFLVAFADSELMIPTASV
jgi:acyl carrier protein